MEDFEKEYMELMEGIKALQQEAYDKLIQFVDDNYYYSIHRDTFIYLIDNLVTLLGGIYE